MKTYHEQGDGSLFLRLTPQSYQIVQPFGRREILKEVEAGTAKIISYDSPEPEAQAKKTR